MWSYAQGFRNTLGLHSYLLSLCYLIIRVFHVQLSKGTQIMLPMFHKHKVNRYFAFTYNREQHLNVHMNKNKTVFLWITTYIFLQVCQSCLKCDAADTKAAPGTPQSIQNMQLREDISQDGEQLLSDLTNLQKSYMEELPMVAEMSCDISELLNNATHKERKRRHSFIVDDPG